jgi:hypothetical protein
MNDFVYDYKAFNATIVLRHTLLFYKLFSDNITLKILKAHNKQFIRTRSKFGQEYIFWFCF